MNRSRILKCGLRIVAPMLILFSITSAHAMSGREVYDKVHEVRTKALDHKMEAAMVLFDKGGGTRSRTLVAYGRKGDAEAYKVLVLFKTPPDLKDVGFLVHARTFAERGVCDAPVSVPESRLS